MGWFGLGLVCLVALATFIWRSDIRIAGMDPQTPFQIYSPPPAPNYSDPDAWALWQARGRQTPADAAAVFFVHSTTYDTAREWNAPIGDRTADAYLNRVVLPNYAGPFARMGRVSVPRYRQASLYTRLTLRRDAREARAFAYDDIAAAFDHWSRANPEGPLVLVGVEQGAELLDRLVREQIAPDPALRQRLVAVYLLDAIVAVDNLAASTPPCAYRKQTGCVVGWSQVGDADDGAAARRLRRALIWNDRGRLVDLGEHPTLCVDPVSGSNDGAAISARRHLGGANATGLEWGVRPAVLDRQVTTQCRAGLLRYSEPQSDAFSNRGRWADRRKARPYNLFYADIEADVGDRLMAWKQAHSAAGTRP